MYYRLISKHACIYNDGEGEMKVDMVAKFGELKLVENSIIELLKQSYMKTSHGHFFNSHDQFRMKI